MLAAPICILKHQACILQCVRLHIECMSCVEHLSPLTHPLTDDVVRSSRVRLHHFFLGNFPISFIMEDKDPIEDNTEFMTARERRELLQQVCLTIIILHAVDGGRTAIT